MRIAFQIICLVVVLTVFAGCKKDYDKSVFEELPQERTAQMLKEYKSMLASAPYGWMAYAYTGAGNIASTFFFRFDSTNRVLTNCDISTTTITTPQESSYRIQALQMPTLIFDTYSYLHLLADPNSSTAGGASGSGYTSDFEFYFVQMSKDKDTLYMQGAQKGMPLTLIKISEDSKGLIYDGFLKNGGKDMADMKSKFQYYFYYNTFINLKMQDGKQMTVSSPISLSSPVVSNGIYFRYLDENNKLVSQGTLYSYTATGVHLRDTIWYKGTAITDLVWNKGSNNNFYIDGIFNNSQTINTPDFSLSSLFGNGYTGLYQPSGIPDASSAATSLSYRTLFKDISDSIRGRGYTLREYSFLFNPSAKQMVIYVSVSKGTSTFFGTYTYDYQLSSDGKTYTFTYKEQTSGGQGLRYAMDPLLKYFNNKQLELNYFISTSQGMMGQFKSISDADFYFTALLF